MRTERDSMGEMSVPDDALYGASTQRAVLNFPISGQRMPEGFIRALGLLKWAAARANGELGRLSAEQTQWIGDAALEIFEGRLSAHFPVDVFQTGSATSTNTNANEVIANRVCQRLGRPLGSRDVVHPGDHVNLGQSSNDVIPSALHVSVALALDRELAPALAALGDALEQKAGAFRAVMKIGRTHLMDAVPLTLGQEFSGYATQVRKAQARCRRAIAALEELAIGGTAVGTGLNTHPRFAGLVCHHVAERTGLAFREAGNHFEAQGARDDCVEVAGELQAIAAALTKIANDIRLLGSGPRAGLGELRLPPTQPGSSIMPGKVNPVMSEMLVQMCLYVHGLCTTVALAGREGHLELNAMLPLMAHCLHQAVPGLARAAATFTARCVRDLEVDVSRCREYVERSLMLVTALTPHLGYDRAAEVAKRAAASQRTLREVVLELGWLDAATLDRALDPRQMLGEGEASR